MRIPNKDIALIVQGFGYLVLVDQPLNTISNFLTGLTRNIGIVDEDSCIIAGRGIHRHNLLTTKFAVADKPFFATRSNAGNDPQIWRLKDLQDQMQNADFQIWRRKRLQDPKASTGQIWRRPRVRVLQSQCRQMRRQIKKISNVCFSDILLYLISLILIFYLAGCL